MKIRLVIATFIFAGGSAGCADCPAVEDTQVVGGTEGQQVVVRNALAALSAELEAPVCIDHVRLGASLREGIAGAYNAATRGVRLSRDLDTDRVASVTRHEVCHGVDLQNDIVARSDGAFVYPSPPEVIDAHVANEAFAVTCEASAATLSVLWASDCPLDPDLRGASVVREEVYGLVGEPDPAARFVGVASVGVGPDVAFVTLLPMEDGHLSAFLYQDDGEFTFGQLDPWTGRWIEDPTLEVASQRVPEEIRGPPGWDLPGDAAGGHLDGVEIVTASLELVTGRVYRTQLWISEEWAPADGSCPNGTTRFFAFDAELWSSQLDGTVLSWGRWERI